MARIFKNAKRKTKQVVEKVTQPIPSIINTPEPSITATPDFSHCPATIDHPSVGDWTHHSHGDICCKCGTNIVTGDVLSKAKLAEFRKNNW